MTALTDYPFRVDGTSLGTYAFGQETVEGIHVIAARRDTSQRVSYRHGDYPGFDLWADPKFVPLSLWLSGTDANGAVTHAEGERGHIEENWKTLSRILGKKGAAIDLELDVPKVGGGVETLEAEAKVVRAVRVRGSRGLRRINVVFKLSWPFWHLLPVVSDLANSGTFNIDTSDATAVIADMVITFKSGTNQRLTVNSGPWSGQYVEWLGTAPAAGIEIDVGARTITNLNTSAAADRLFHPSDEAWMEWPPGVASLGMTLTGGGTVDLSYYIARE